MSVASRVSKIIERREAAPLTPRERRADKAHNQCRDGLCKACGWADKRVPDAWLTQNPGSPYPGKSKLIGQQVVLRAGEPSSTIVATATPLGETIFQQGRSLRYKCQGSFIVRTPMGRGAIETPVPKSVVRERMRVPKREGNCPDAPEYTSATMKGLTQALERDSLKAGRHPYDGVGELPYPHRKGSSPCCTNSRLNPTELDKLVAAWAESGEESDFEAARAAVVRALPKQIRATAVIETRAELLAAIRAVRDHCWQQWVAHEGRITEPSKNFQRRVKENRKAMVNAGLEDPGSLLRRRQAAGVKRLTDDERAQLEAREAARAPARVGGIFASVESLIGAGDE